MLKVNHNHSADEENVHIHIAMNQQQAAKTVKMSLAFGQAMDAGRLSINFLQQDSHGVTVVSQMAEEFGCIGVHIWMMTCHFAAPLGEGVQFSPRSTNQRAADNNLSVPRATANRVQQHANEEIRPTEHIMVEYIQRRLYKVVDA
ncbi:hypothetical protein T069G_04885 [Trichoderma breve]|uniref:Uncharacterized protein n=1 Tax=Trichoderma breve TaxID=2034170 RepID=A0A9W9E7Z3_9HYPO|nr:hypothetical protein T069G_04885 [Trichoderma breve]KAJ4859897.1 hypothetical protein T069G_04885 [Trichoderma breve]